MDLKIDVKSDQNSQKTNLNLSQDLLEELFHEFGPIADKVSLDGDFGPVEGHWKQYTTAFQVIINLT